MFVPANDTSFFPHCQYHVPQSLSTSNCPLWNVVARGSRFQTICVLPLPAIMPKLQRGVYAKIGYPLELVIEGDLFHFEVSGQTRMVYRSESRPHLIAKIMPASGSPNWREGWDQNDRWLCLLWSAWLSSLWSAWPSSAEKSHAWGFRAHPRLGFCYRCDTEPPGLLCDDG